ncbi:hypothetical protein H180DRAFT_01522 [Streptomyces sp. WMMB 322]|nr:hypothetical protein H180DRAFT_01522 [Streptomyces sp. WMMB 322]
MVKLGGDGLIDAMAAAAEEMQLRVGSELLGHADAVIGVG